MKKILEKTNLTKSELFFVANSFRQLENMTKLDNERYNNLFRVERKYYKTSKFISDLSSFIDEVLEIDYSKPLSLWNYAILQSILNKPRAFVHQTNSVRASYEVDYKIFMKSSELKFYTNFYWFVISKIETKKISPRFRYQNIFITKVRNIKRHIENLKFITSFDNEDKNRFIVLNFLTSVEKPDHKPRYFGVKYLYRQINLSKQSTSKRVEYFDKLTKSLKKLEDIYNQGFSPVFDTEKLLEEIKIFLGPKAFRTFVYQNFQCFPEEFDNKIQDKEFFVRSNQELLCWIRSLSELNILNPSVTSHHRLSRFDFVKSKRDNSLLKFLDEF